MGLDELPSVDEVLRTAPARDLLGRAPRQVVVAAVRAELEALRGAMRAGATGAPVVDAARLEARVAERLRPSLRRVINATGVVLHTNLGRAPLHATAAARVAEIAAGYSTLEYRPDERRRGSRHDHVGALLCELTGAEAGCVVNNNAAAVLLALSALAPADRRAVVVSRGELVEIGGSFRMPDVMAAAGVALAEIGTTNKTRASDYEAALRRPDVGLVIKVHRSNFVQRGFVDEVSFAEVAALARAAGVTSVADVGSGLLERAGSSALREEPAVRDVVAAGYDLVTFSGDKLLGGPQAGLLVGRAGAVARARQHPLMRALRPDKLQLAALEATLQVVRDQGAGALPVHAMLEADVTALRARAEALRLRLGESIPDLAVRLVEVRSAVGGGALPEVELPSVALALERAGSSPDDLDHALRRADPPVIGRIAEGRYLLDVRTLQVDDTMEVVRALRGALHARK